MNLQQINDYIFRIFDVPGDYNLQISDAEVESIIAFLQTEGYISVAKDAYRVGFTDKGYDILFKINDGTNLDKLATFGELKKLSEKLYGQR